MEDNLKKIDKNISQIRVILIRMDKTLALNTKDLEEHMRRTEISGMSPYIMVCLLQFK